MNKKGKVIVQNIRKPLVKIFGNLKLGGLHKKKKYIRPKNPILSLLNINEAEITKIKKILIQNFIKTHQSKSNHEDATDATGAIGATGSSQTNSKYACVSQMTNILAQVITLFPDENIKVNFENGGSAAGRPSLVSNNSVLVLKNSSGAITDKISVCKIAYISLTGNDSFGTPGNLKITFLPAPSPLPTGCEAGMRDQLTPLVATSTTVDVKAGGSATGQQAVTATAFGIAILGSQIAVSTCLMEAIS